MKFQPHLGSLSVGESSRQLALSNIPGGGSQLSEYRWFITCMLIYPGVQGLFSSLPPGAYQRTRDKNKRATVLLFKFAHHSVVKQKPGIFDMLQQFTR